MTGDVFRFMNHFLCPRDTIGGEEFTAESMNAVSSTLHMVVEVYRCVYVCGGSGEDQPHGKK